MSRQCGECDACCSICEVPELAKPVDTKCEHCSGGCAIYEARPPSCRTFNCYWLKNLDVPDSFRPDKCGVMLEYLKTSKTLLAYADSNDWNTPKVTEWLQSLAKDGRAVVLKAGANRHLFVPDGRTAQSVWSDVIAEAKAEGI